MNENKSPSTLHALHGCCRSLARSLIIRIHDHLPLIPHVDRPQLLVLLAPFLQMRNVDFVALQVIRRSKVHQHRPVRIDRRHLHVVRIRKVHFAEFLGIIRAFRIEFAHQLHIIFIRAARVDSGSDTPVPTSTGKEYFFAPPGGRSITTPLASISAIFEPICTNPMGTRSLTPTFSRFGSRRITDADSTHGIFSSCACRSASGTKKTFLPMSAPITEITCPRETCWMPVIS